MLWKQQKHAHVPLGIRRIDVRHFTVRETLRPHSVQTTDMVLVAKWEETLAAYNRLKEPRVWWLFWWTIAVTARHSMTPVRQPNNPWSQRHPNKQNQAFEILCKGRMSQLLAAWEQKMWSCHCKGCSTSLRWNFISYQNSDNALQTYLYPHTWRYWDLSLQLLHVFVGVVCQFIRSQNKPSLFPARNSVHWSLFHHGTLHTGKAQLQTVTHGNNVDVALSDDIPRDIPGVSHIFLR